MEPIMVTKDVGLKEVQGMVVQPDNELTYLQSKLQEVRNEVVTLEAEKAELFAVEQARKTQLEGWLQKLYKQRDLLQNKIAILTSPYTSWIPMEPLRWRNETTKLPSLALFSLNSSGVNLLLQWHNTNYPSSKAYFQFEPYLPSELYEHYRDLYTLFLQPPYIPTKEEEPHLRSQPLKVCISASFQGTIPSEVRRKIRSVLDSRIFGNEVYLLCEVENWKVTRTSPAPHPVRLDPLVVGWNKVYPDRLWYIDAFDISPLENRIPIVI